MAHIENSLKDLRKETFFALVLNLENKREKFMEKFCEHLDNLCNTLDNLSSELDQIKSSLIVTKTVNGHFLNWITSLKSRGNIHLIRTQTVTKS